MARASASAPDTAGTVYSGTISTPSSGPWCVSLGRMRLNLWGTFTGLRAIVECSFDGGTTAIPATYNGTVVEFTGPASERLTEVENDVLYRVTVLAIASGTLN